MKGHSKIMRLFAAAFAIAASAVSVTNVYSAVVSDTVVSDTVFADTIPFKGTLSSVSAVVIDAATGTVLFAQNPDLEIPPASLTKLMTMHIAFMAARRGETSLSDIVALPPEVWAQNQPSRSSLMFLDQGQIVTLHELLLGLAIPSGNDAAAALALHFAPTIEGFAALMNAEARRLGLTKTRFTEPSGIDHNNITTALEFARFCREYVRLNAEALQNYHSVSEFAYPKEKNLPPNMRGRRNYTIVQPNHIPLMGEFDGVDGLKTGFIDESGYNAAVTAERNGTRFIVVTLGVPASFGMARGYRARAEDCRKLLEWAFASFKTLRPRLPALPDIRVWKSKQKFMPLVPAQDSAVTVTQGRGAGLRWEIETDFPVIAPVAARSPAGLLRLYDKEGLLYEMPLLTAERAEQGGFFRRLWDSIALFFARLSKNTRVTT